MLLKKLNFQRKYIQLHSHLEKWVRKNTEEEVAGGIFTAEKWRLLLIDGGGGSEVVANSSKTTFSLGIHPFETTSLWLYVVFCHLNSTTNACATSIHYTSLNITLVPYFNCNIKFIIVILLQFIWSKFMCQNKYHIY